MIDVTDLLTDLHQLLRVVALEQFALPLNVFSRFIPLSLFPPLYSFQAAGWADCKD